MDKGSVTPRLLESLIRLAATSDVQRDWLEAVGTAPLADELALELAEALAPYRHRMEELPFSDAAIETIMALDHHLESFSGQSNARLWDVESLDEPAWIEARDLAARALDEIGIAEREVRMPSPEERLP